MTELCKVDLLSTSPNLYQRTTMWNTDAPDCYISLWLFVSDAHFCIISSTEGGRWFIDFVVLNILSINSDNLQVSCYTNLQFCQMMYISLVVWLIKLLQHSLETTAQHHAKLEHLCFIRYCIDI